MYFTHEPLTILYCILCQKVSQFNQIIAIAYMIRCLNRPTLSLYRTHTSTQFTQNNRCKSHAHIPAICTTNEINPLLTLYRFTLY